MLLTEKVPTARRVKALQDKVAGIARQMRGILDEVGDGDWKPEQEGEYHSLEKQLDKGQLELAREVKGVMRRPDRLVAARAAWRTFAR